MIVNFTHALAVLISTGLDMGRVWRIDALKGSSNTIALAYDEGTVVIKVGSDEPVCSMRYSSNHLLI